MRTPAVQHVLSVRARIPEAAVAAFVGDALDSIRLYSREHEIALDGPPFARIRPSGKGIADAEAGWPTSAPASGSGRIHAGAFPCDTVDCRNRFVVFSDDDTHAVA
jgi:hypothetical protein